jgi:hypothetical protein
MDVKMKQMQRAHSCILYPMYEDEGYTKFVAWEIYYCSCGSGQEFAEKKFSWDTCDCWMEESMPIDTAENYRDALKLAKAIGEQRSPMVLWGVRF